MSTALERKHASGVSRPQTFRFRISCDGERNYTKSAQIRIISGTKLCTRCINRLHLKLGTHSQPDCFCLRPSSVCGTDQSTAPSVVRLHHFPTNYSTNTYVDNAFYWSNCASRSSRTGAIGPVKCVVYVRIRPIVQVDPAEPVQFLTYRGQYLNRTYGTQKKLHISLF